VIAIVNISPEPKPFGEHTYSLRINRMEICQFQHRREDGLAACLMAAARMVERNKWMDAKHLPTGDHKHDIDIAPPLP